MNIEGSIALDVLSCVFMLALLTGLAGVRTGRLSDKLYFILIVFVEVLLLSDIAYLFWLREPSAQTMTAAFYVKNLYFVANAGVIWMWARYVDFTLFGAATEDPSRPLRTFRALYHGVLVVNIVIVLINLPTGWMFSLSPDGAFSGNQLLMWVFTLLNYGVGVMVVATLLVRRKTLSGGVLLSFTLFLAIPLAAEVVQLVDRTYALTCAYALSGMLLYQVSRNNLIYTDDLTALGNRRLLFRSLNRWFSDLRTKTVCGIMIDLDGLKRVNDCHGHAAGDDALVSLAGIVRQSMPISAVAARYGGDEFVIAWKGDRGPRADDVLGRLESHRAAVNERPFPWGELEFSAGALCCERGECPDSAEFMKRLDEGMYRDKRSKAAAL